MSYVLVDTYMLGFDFEEQRIKKEIAASGC